MKRALLVLVPLVGCSALPGGGRAVFPRVAYAADGQVAASRHEHGSHHAAPIASPSRPARLPRARSASDQLSQLALAFEPTDRADVFVGRAARYAVRVGATWAEMVPTARGSARQVAPRAVTMRFEGALPATRAVTTARAPGTVSYYAGPSSRWRTDLPTFDRVTFADVYPGIDVAYYGTNREIEYDLLVSPGSDPGQIALAFDGADSISLEPGGDLGVTAGSDVFTLRAPVAYQEHQGIRTPVTCRYETSGPTSARLVVGAYDREQPLVIDPVLTYSALLGGTGLDEAVSVKVDTAGFVYLVGTTASTNFPGAPVPARGIDVFVAKLDSRGTLLYSAYVGGAGVDEARGLAVDTTGHVYVAGTTSSTDFPTRVPRQPASGGGNDAFVLKLSTTGSGMVFSTYHGGAEADEASGIGIDASLNVYVTGQTRSANFPLAAQRQGARLGTLDGFVSRFTPTGTGLSYSTYHGGTAADAMNGIAVDANGNATVVGSTTSTDFPVVAPTYGANGGQSDAVISRFTPTGTLAYSTYWGGANVDVAQGVAVNASGTAFVVGTTASANFPLVRPLQAQLGGPIDAFLVVVTPAVSVTMSTFYGGSRSERGRSVAINASGRVVIAGQTMSSDLPVQQPAQRVTGGNRDTFVAQLDPPYAAVTHATYLGGSNNDEGMGTAIDRVGRVFVAGAATYPFAGAHGASDAFVYGLSTAAAGADFDVDGLPDDWESQYGLDPTTAETVADPDGDGINNATELTNHTHPHGFYTRYLAEGSTGAFFDDRIALFNPSSSMARVLLRYQRPAGTPEIQQFLSMAAHSRLTVNPELIAGLEGASFATVVEADQAVVVDRTMTWDSRGFGSHTETSSESPSTEWYLAEGATGGTFDLYYLLQNPSTAQARVTITYLRPAGRAPITKSYDVAPRSRLTVNVDNECFPVAPCSRSGRQLSDTDVSAKITSTVPILVERAMYMTAQGRLWAAGHDSAGVTSPAVSWFLAEGATGPFFDMFILLANPNGVATNVEITYLLLGGSPITRIYEVAGNSRRTVYVNADAALARVSTSAVVRTLNPAAPIVVERAMWWPGGNWTEAHNSAGAIVTSPRWALAEGEVGGPRGSTTYVLIANTSPAAANVRVSVFYEDQGESQEQTVTVPGRSRFNVDMSAVFPMTEGRRFSVLVEGTGATPPELVVERAVYSNVGTQIWAAGTNALGTPVFPSNTFTVTASGIFPKVLVVDEGSQIRIVNRDPSATPTTDCGQGGHDISDDPHPTHGDYPEFGIGRLDFGQARVTQNLIDVGAFGVHDHCRGTDAKWKARVVVKPLP